MRTHEVFGIQPELREASYIDRGHLDAALQKLIERQQTHIALRGASKSGKSWLRQKALSNPIIVQCRMSWAVEDIYRDALARLDIALELERTVTNGISGSITATGEAGVKLLAKVTGKAEGEISRDTATKEKRVGKDATDLEFIASLIRASGRMLVIEDFHYLSVDQQRRFAFDLKTLWDYKTFVLIVGVWISENMLITLNPDLSDRIEELSVTWQPAELKAVLNKGCTALNLRVTDAVANQLADISYESVGLLQKLALRFLDDELGIAEGALDGTEIVIDKLGVVTDAAMHVAEQLNQLYQTFANRVAKGIRTRSNKTGIYAHAMAAVMAANDGALATGLSAKDIFTVAHERQPRVQYSNLKAVLAKFPDLQVDDQGRGLVLAYDHHDEKVSVVDKQLLLYRRFATVKWPWEDLIAEADKDPNQYEGAEDGG